MNRKFSVQIGNDAEHAMKLKLLMTLLIGAIPKIVEMIASNVVRITISDIITRQKDTSFIDVRRWWVVEDGKRTCIRCHEKKNVEEMTLRKESDDGFSNECKKCCNLRNRIYNFIRRQHDAAFKLQMTIRTRLHCSLKGRKNDYTMKYIGCTIAFLKAWLSKHFTQEMSWDNHGEYWQIDHVLPVTTFDMDDPLQVKICFNWSNMRPLPKQENSSKSNRFLPSQISAHYNSLIELQTQLTNNTPEYQALGENLTWLRKKHSGMVTISSDDGMTSDVVPEIGNPQPKF